MIHTKDQTPVLANEAATRGPASQEPTPEEQLVDRCLTGDRKAWQELIQTYERLIYSVACRQFRDPGVIDDVFQDVCIDLYEHLGDIRDPAALPAWIITVTRRKCTKVIADLPEWTEVDSKLEAGEQDADLAAIERRFYLERAMEELNPRDRVLIEMLYFDPKQPSYSEIARQLGMPVTSIGPTRARCLEKLRKVCGQLR